MIEDILLYLLRREQNERQGTLKMAKISGKPYANFATASCQNIEELQCESLYSLLRHGIVELVFYFLCPKPLGLYTVGVNVPGNHWST
jgi:hypothetical protein